MKPSPSALTSVPRCADEPVAHDLVVTAHNGDPSLIAQPFGHLRRALDVGEDDRDGAVGRGVLAQVGPFHAYDRRHGVDGCFDGRRIDALGGHLVDEHALDEHSAGAALPVEVEGMRQLLDRGAVIAEVRRARPHEWNVARLLEDVVHLLEDLDGTPEVSGRVLV